MLKYTNSFIEVSALGDFETEINKLYRQLVKQSRDGAGTSFDPISANAPNIKQDYMYSNILTDTGSGRLSKGLKSLELLAVMRSGTSIQNLFLFDNVIYAGTVADFNTVDRVSLIQIVLANLGMADIVASIDDSITRNFQSVCYKIGMRVKDGTYTADQYSSYIIKEGRRLTRKVVS